MASQVGQSYGFVIEVEKKIEKVFDLQFTSSNTVVITLNDENEFTEDRSSY